MSQKKQYNNGRVQCGKDDCKAIQSVIDQTYRNWEMLIINDCSTDGTAQIVESFSDSRIYLFNNASNYGVSKTRKAGLDSAKGEWIVFLDSDDVWKPGKLKKQISLTSATEAKLIFTGSTFMDDEEKNFDWVLHVPQTIKYKELLKHNLMSNSSILVKKNLYRAYYAIGDGMHKNFAIWLRITSDGHTAYERRFII